MRYLSLGTVPPKRHVQVRTGGSGNGHAGALLTEEVPGYEGFSGNESILYHLHSPCRLADVGEFTPIRRDEWVPDAHVHRLAGAKPLPARRVPPRGRPLF